MYRWDLPEDIESATWVVLFDAVYQGDLLRGDLGGMVWVVHHSATIMIVQYLWIACNCDAGT
jgi:hypothetical protein